MKVVQGLASTNTRTLNAWASMTICDFCVKFDGRWLIKEKRIYRCNDEMPLPCANIQIAHAGPTRGLSGRVTSPDFPADGPSFVLWLLQARRL